MDYRASMDGDVAGIGEVKALANPLRQRILRELELIGDATATLLAVRLGVTTGGTSYNPRILAEHGLVDGGPERARGRERWWRRPAREPRVARPSPQSPALRHAMD